MLLWHQLNKSCAVKLTISDIVAPVSIHTFSLYLHLHHSLCVAFKLIKLPFAAIALYSVTHNEKVTVLLEMFATVLKSPLIGNVSLFWLAYSATLVRLLGRWSHLRRWQPVHLSKPSTGWLRKPIHEQGPHFPGMDAMYSEIYNTIKFA